MNFLIFLKFVIGTVTNNVAGEPEKLSSFVFLAILTKYAVITKISP